MHECFKANKMILVFGVPKLVVGPPLVEVIVLEVELISFGLLHKSLLTESTKSTTFFS